MSCQYYILLFLFLCGFAALSVSVICGREILEGASCTIKLKTENSDRPNEIKWIHLTSGDVIHWKNGKIKTNTLGVKMEEDGSLTFESVSLKNTGEYKYTVFNAGDGTETSGEEDIKVYAKAPKPTVKISCKDGNATLTCGTGDRTDLTVSWYKEDTIIENEKNPQLLLTSSHIQDNIPYSCSVSNPVSNEQSDSVTVSCATGEGDPGPRTLFNYDFWIMVSILAGSGALLLLLLCVLIICACQSCSQHKKHKQDEEELRLSIIPVPDPNTVKTAHR